MGGSKKPRAQLAFTRYERDILVGGLESLQRDAIAAADLAELRGTGSPHIIERARSIASSAADLKERIRVCLSQA